MRLLKDDRLSIKVQLESIGKLPIVLSPKGELTLLMEDGKSLLAFIRVLCSVTDIFQA